MKLSFLLVSACLVTVQLFAQKPAQKGAQKPAQNVIVNEYAAIDQKALLLPPGQVQSAKEIAQYINANFTSDADKVRAAFIWVASNIQYDVDNMYAINFNEKTEDRLAKTFATHKGICIDYANIFNDVCNQCGIPSYKVTGYTKQNGQAGYAAHAWCVAFVDNDWFVFDPTWGAGYTSNSSTFVPRINNEYYKAKPAKMISSHMPFDPLWECLNYPITNAEFYGNSMPSKTTKNLFSYRDSIKVWGQQTVIEQYIAAARRVEANGVKNALIYDRLFFLKSQIKYHDDSLKNATQFNHDSLEVANYNGASHDYTEGVNKYNVFINYRNKQFTPKKEDTEIQQMIDAADNQLAKARAKLAVIKTPKPSVAELMISLNKSIDEIQSLVDAQKAFVAKYLSKGKLGRALMFTNLNSSSPGRK